MAKKISPAIRSFFERNGQKDFTSFDAGRFSSIDRLVASGSSSSDILGAVQTSFSNKYRLLSSGAQRELSKLIEKELR